MEKNVPLGVFRCVCLLIKNNFCAFFVCIQYTHIHCDGLVQGVITAFHPMRAGDKNQQTPAIPVGMKQGKIYIYKMNEWIPYP